MIDSNASRPHHAALRLLLTELTATLELARAIAPCLAPGFKLYLSGNLGCGKTEFTRALLRALGHTGRVKSPSYALVEPYNLSKFELHHFDFYRLTDADAWREAGFEEDFAGTTVTVLEWPEMAGGLPPPDLWLRLAFAAEHGEQARRVEVEAHTSQGLQCLGRLRAAGFCTEP